MDIKSKLVIMLILLILTVVIVLQNTGPVNFKLLFWDFQASLIILLLLVFLIGVIIGFIIPKLFKKKKAAEHP